MNPASEYVTFEKTLKEQRRFFADTADYLLERLARTMETSFVDAAEKDDTLDGLLVKIGNVALDSHLSSGQTIMNRAFHIAQSHADKNLAGKIDTMAIDRDFRSPSVMSLDA